jgi:hypothetical protein
VPIVICFEETPPTDPDRPPAMMIQTYLDVLAPVLPPAFQVGSTFFAPDLTDWVPEPSVPQEGQSDPGARAVVLANGEELSQYRETVRAYTISRVAGTVEEADQWLCSGDPQRRRCLLTLGEFPAVKGQLPPEIQPASMVAELWMGDQAQRRVYVVMNAVEPEGALGYVFAGPPALASRAA